MELKPRLAAELTLEYISDHIPVMIMGAPGIGKSDMIRGICREKNWGLVDMRLSMIDPVDLRGMPSVSDGKAVFAQLGELPDEKRDGKEGILFLDELPQAPMAVQNAAFSLVWDRRIGDYHLPQGWHVVSAGNRASDRAGAGRLNSALANRFAHIDMVHDLDDWCKWALGAGVPPVVVSFIRFRPGLLHDFNPDRKINPTPRTWEMAARKVGKGLSPELENAALSGLIGTPVAAELLAFLRIWRKLPNPDSVFLDPMGAIVPNDAAVLYAISGALARKVGANSMGPFIQYLSRLPAEYGVIAMKDAMRRDKTLAATPAAIEWFAANDEIYL